MKRIAIPILFSLCLLAVQFYPSIVLADQPEPTLNYKLQNDTPETIILALNPSYSTSAESTHTAPIVTERLFSLDYGKLVLDDTKYILSSPFRWESKEWINASLASLAIIGTAAGLDKPIRDHVQEHRTSSTDKIAKYFQRFGAEYSLGVLGTYYIAGVTFDDSKAKTIALDGLSASLIASGIITPILKEVTGRSRPSQNEGAYKFKPFSGKDSFPSGHATQAFAVASVIAEHNEAWWIKFLAYGTASMVGYARIEKNAHYTSDVFAGAVIGTAVGRTVVLHNQKKRSQFSINPYIDGDMRGMAFSYSF